MPARRTFTVSAGGVTVVNAVVTLVFVNPPASPSVPITIIRAWVSQSNSATAVMQRVQLNTQVTAFPTLTSATPIAHNRGDTTASVIAGGTAGAAGTCGIDATAEGAGAKTVIVADAFVNVSGWLWLPTEEERIVLPAGLASGFGLHLPVAPATLTDWAFGLTWQEG